MDHCNQELAVESAAGTTAIKSLQLRSGGTMAIKSLQLRLGGDHCDQELGVEVRRGPL